MLNTPSLVDPTKPALRLKYVVELIVIAILYAVVAKASLALASINPSASPIWPPTGFALACTLLWGYRVWRSFKVLLGQVARRTKNFEDFDAAFSSRIRALADVHDLLVMQNWEGAPIREVIRTQLAPFAQIDTRRLTIEGPELMLKPKAVEHIGLALHELATNATKYCALSLPEGLITIHWTVETDSLETQQVRFDWKESGGPTVSAPHHKGFGHMVVMQLVPKALEGNAQINYSTDGLGWTLQAPAANVIETASGPRR